MSLFFVQTSATQCDLMLCNRYVRKFTIVLQMQPYMPGCNHFSPKGILVDRTEAENSPYA